jgi:prepilin-type N-terminal cleavage/methylation domain-containing protein
MKQSRQSMPLRDHKRSGFSLVEVMIATCVLTIGLLALSSTSVVIHSLDRADEARSQATSAIQRVVEHSKSVSARSTQGNVGTWATRVTAALRPGGVIGDVFDVPGLDPWQANPNIGTVLVITDETVTDASLGVTLGMPRDLNGDGDAGDADVSADATLLPVIVRTRWGGAGGDREATQAFYLTSM